MHSTPVDEFIRKQWKDKQALQFLYVHQIELQCGV